jgi:proline iminopeptidase
MPRDRLYPVPQNIKRYRLRVDKLHKLYIEDCGNRKKGIPVLFLHGGPGWPVTNGSYARFTSPKKFRIITFHQRGCGRSTPLGSLVRNKTNYLIEDIEKIRKAFKIKKWIVTGGSWGATLSVLYAIAHPSRVLGVVIFGLGLFKKNHLMEEATKIMAPDIYAKWQLKKTEKQTMNEYMRKLQSKSKKIREEYTKKWSYEDKLFKLMDFPRINQNIIGQDSGHDDDIKKSKLKAWKTAMALLECYYYKNQAFTTPAKLLNGAKTKLKHIPGIIVHGRFDLICSPENSWILHQHWPNSRLYIAPKSGHGMFDKPAAKAILRSFEFLYDLLTKPKKQK